MSKNSGDPAFGAGVILWLVVCTISGASIVGCIFLLAGLLLFVPKVWNHYISKTFSDRTEKTLLLVALILVILGVFCLIT
jgi:uncharacterized membrane protein